MRVGLEEEQKYRNIPEGPRPDREAAARHGEDWPKMRFRNPFRRKDPPILLLSREESAALYRGAAQEWLVFRGQGNDPEVLCSKAKVLAARIIDLGVGFGNEFRVRFRDAQREFGFDVDNVSVRSDFMFFEMHLVHRRAKKLWPPEQVAAFMQELVDATAWAIAQSVDGAGAHEDVRRLFAEGLKSYSEHFWKFREGGNGASAGEIYWESARRLARGLGHDWDIVWLTMIQTRLFQVTLVLAIEPLLEPDEWRG